MPILILLLCLKSCGSIKNVEHVHADPQCQEKDHQQDDSLKQSDLQQEGLSGIWSMTAGFVLHTCDRSFLVVARCSILAHHKSDKAMLAFGVLL